jgi:hypothetical protein
LYVYPALQHSTPQRLVLKLELCDQLGGRLVLMVPQDYAAHQQLHQEARRRFDR